MTPSLLDSDTLTLWHKGHPGVVAHAASYVKQFGQLTISDLAYYEINRGLKAVGASEQPLFTVGCELRMTENRPLC
jgi:hypothetical protein